MSRRTTTTHTLLLIAILCGFGMQAQAQDAKNSSDHPLFPNRMPGYRISNFEQEGFASYRFQTRPPLEIEGALTRINYNLVDRDRHPGSLAILRNYENAIKAAGGEVVFSNDRFVVMKGRRDSLEVWAQVEASTGRYYFMHIIERVPMEQVISADSMAAVLNSRGFLALDVHFATGKADILPESVPLIDEVVRMLTAQRTMRVGIEGHTDNTGSPATNQTLSDARARSVVDALVTAGISRDRLDPKGYGQTMPIADNRTDEGRATNRRVEIVKR